MEFAENASKLHKKIGEILSTTSPFEGCTLKQEVIVSSLFPSYPNNKDRYDWVIPSMFTIIEAHGIQHYKVATFGKEASEAVMDFQTQKLRDKQKEEIAILSGWTYIIIPYTDEKIVDSKYLISQYNLNYNPKSPAKKVEKEMPEWQKIKNEEAKQKSKAIRKELYRKAKEKHDRNKKSNR